MSFGAFLSFFVCDFILRYENAIRISGYYVAVLFVDIGR